MPTVRRSIDAQAAFIRLIVVCAVSISLAGCSSGASGSGPSAQSGAAPTPAGSRLSSPAIVTIVQPTPNEVITGTTVHVVLAVANATIVKATTTAVRPDQGHIHLYVDNVLVSMNYGTTQDITVQPGTWDLKAEFVASDHAPFNPRVWSPEVLFTVK